MALNSLEETSDKYSNSAEERQMKKRQIIAILMLSPFYFSLSLQQRFNIVERLFSRGH